MKNFAWMILGICLLAGSLTALDRPDYLIRIERQTEGDLPRLLQILIEGKQLDRDHCRWVIFYTCTRCHSDKNVDAAVFDEVLGSEYYPGYFKELVRVSYPKSVLRDLDAIREYLESLQNRN